MTKKPKVMRSMESNSVVLSRPLGRMNRSKILEALRVVLQDLSESYMIDPAEYKGRARVWVSKYDYECMAVARLNGRIK